MENEMQQKPSEEQMPPTLEGHIVPSKEAPFDGDMMQITVSVANHLEAYEKALNSIMNFIVKRTYAGDWVSHDKEGTSAEDRTVNMSGAAAERIARDLGIQETNRTKPMKLWDEAHKGHYAYECQGDFSFRGRSIKAIGRATTLNPFYSKRGGMPRKPEDISEEYIIRDAWRDCTKQAIKGLFGLRKIPLMKLKELGYDITKVKYVNFKEGGQGGKADPAATATPETAQTTAASTEDAGEWVNVQIDNMIAKVSKGGKPFFSVKDSEGSWMTIWGSDTSSGVKILKDAMAKKTAVSMLIVKNGQFTTISEVRP